MTYIFVSRLYKITLSQSAMDYNERLLINTNIDLKNEPLLLNNKNETLIKVSVKITILSVTSLLSSLLLIALLAIANFVKWTEDTFLNKAVAFWLQMDTMISSVCLVLFLPNTKKIYGIFCWCCKVTLKQCMTKSVRRSTIRLGVLTNVT
eukprot:209115_1